MTVRWHLAQLLLVCIVPVGIFGAAMLYLHWLAHEAQRERSQVESVRILSTAVDNALDSTVQRLSIFARVIAAGDESDPSIYRQAQRALEGNPDWTNILLWTADGQGVFRLDQPHGSAMPPMRLRHVWGPTLDARQPVVSDIFESPVYGAKFVAVAVPVVRDEKVTHVLIANLNLGWFDRLLAQQDLHQGGGVAGIFDRDWRFVARSSEGDARRGTGGAPALVADMKVRREGIGRYASLDQIDVYTSWTGTRHGWSVAYATPAAPIEAAFWSHLAGFGLLWLAAVGAGILFALRKSRLISRSLTGLERNAGMLARGHELAGLPASQVLEVDRALSALEQASAVVSAALADRERALSVEREARGAAERANRAKDEFLAMLSHELRNPIGAISNAVGILRGPASAEHAAFATSVIARQSQHLKRLIDDLLDVGRAITGKIMIAREPVDLAASARHVVSALQATGRLAERRLSVDLSPAWVAGDVTRIEQILTNLLLNAVNHTPPGGHIRIEVARDGEAALLRVSDDGSGIAPEHLPRLFDLFFQGDTSIDRDRGGLGIGLTLVQRLAALHGGTVSAESEGLGRGARFTVHLPAAPASADAAVRAEGPEIKPMSLI